MRKSIISLFMALACIMISCSEDKEPVEPMFSGFVTAYTNHDGQIYKIMDDMGGEYAINEKTDALTPDTTVRFVVSMSLNNDGSAHILQLVPPLYSAMKAPETSALPDSLLVQDPVQVNAAYIGGGYLNITLGVKVQKDSRMHTLFYARRSDKSNLTFTVYHNDGGDEPMYTTFAYISIPLKYYGLNRNDTVSLKCKGYQEDCNMKLVYR